MLGGKIIQFDADGRELYRSTTVDGQTLAESFEYDENGRLIRSTDIYGLVTETQYEGSLGSYLDKRQIKIDALTWA